MKQGININCLIIEDSQSPSIISENSYNHYRIIDRAFGTTKTAAKCGVYAIKIQTYAQETMTIDFDKEDFMMRDGLCYGHKIYCLHKWEENPYEWYKDKFKVAKTNENSKKLFLTN